MRETILTLIGIFLFAYLSIKAVKVKHPEAVTKTVTILISGSLNGRE